MVSQQQIFRMFISLAWRRFSTLRDTHVKPMHRISLMFTPVSIPEYNVFVEFQCANILIRKTFTSTIFESFLILHPDSRMHCVAIEEYSFWFELLNLVLRYLLYRVINLMNRFICKYFSCVCKCKKNWLFFAYYGINYYALFSDSLGMFNCSSILNFRPQFSRNLGHSSLEYKKHIFLTTSLFFNATLELLGDVI